MKINIDLNLNTAFMNPLKEHLHDCRVNFVYKNADLFLKQADNITEEDLSSGKTFIALEKRDGANIAQRRILQHPSIIRYVKQYSYINNDYNNLPCVNGRTFTRYLCHESHWESPGADITDLEKKKIILGWNFLDYHRMLPFFNETQWNNSKRKIDVFFAGKIEYLQGDHKSGELISLHRQNCFNKIRSFKGLNVL